ncbi:MAG TPA: xanthine dehydrogenase family protein subunit M [Anaerolineae bacterium]|nr:xanthine dehydrogenase family protein subunit M [Anaerolineae bacterium]
MKVDFLEPTTLDEAVALLSEYADGAKVIAGGTALVLMLQQRLVAPAALVSLGRIPGWDFIRREADGLHVGALTRLRAAERSNFVREFCPALAHAFGVVGNVRVRHQATVGGNLAEADYASDPPAMLLALDARVNAIGPNGKRQIPLSDFFLGFYTTALASNEILSEVVIPPLPASCRAVYLKYTSRSSEDRPCVGVAAVADIDESGHCRDLHVAVGAAVETPQRVPKAEAMAMGESLADDLIDAIADEYARALDPLSDVRGSAWYRREMIRVFVRRALKEVRDGHR